MAKSLDYIHHIAIQVQDIEGSVLWYTSNFDCEISYHDDSWALLKFDNIALALVLPSQHPNHFAVTRDDITLFGTPVPHRDGTSSVYIADPSGNKVEMLKLRD
ncbi:MAG: VOC family protein [Alphaproteobacteria bacterium]|jgi:catechol 2,3-dioxygenase-like lactoylglutathione lyase family enzyme|nr:VOC family protein [Candidatus Jidaibacter sp.]